MSHKSGHIIIESLMEVPELTIEQRSGLIVLANRLEQRGELSTADRMALAWLVYKLTSK